MSDRATISLLLPESGATVHLYEFMVSGDFRRLQRKMLDSIRLKLDIKNTDPKKLPDINDVPGSISMDDQDEALKVLVCKIVDSDGREALDIDAFIYNLPISDGDLLYAKVKEITDRSKLSSADKKK